MNREALDQLRLDRRLMRRKDWIDAKELAAAVEALPDSAGKYTTLGAAADERSGDSEETASTTDA